MKWYTWIHPATSDFSSLGVGRGGLKSHPDFVDKREINDERRKSQPGGKEAPTFGRLSKDRPVGIKWRTSASKIPTSNFYCVFIHTHFNN